MAYIRDLTEKDRWVLALVGLEGVECSLQRVGSYQSFRVYTVAGSAPDEKAVNVSYQINKLVERGLVVKRQMHVELATCGKRRRPKP